MSIKNLKKAADRILKAIKDSERIILYGDGDLDGVSSVIILKETIKTLGGKISYIYFPNREIEGYGLTEKALDFLKEFSPALLVVSDCGIGNFKEIEKAKKLGFSVIIIDHHKVLDRLPKADIIVDPKQEGDKYLFKDLAAVGIVFKLSELIFGGKMTESLRKNFLELVALATIADMMPKVDENKIFIDEGIEYLKNSWRPGIKALFEAEFLKNYNLHEKVSKIISMLNIRDVENKFPTSFLILTNSSSQELPGLIADLKEKQKIRKEKIKEILEEIEIRTSKSNDPIIFEGDSNWDYPLISYIGSIVCRDFKKPTFVFKKLKEESQGTVRVPSGIDSVSWMKKCKDLLMTYGGHAAASGFRIKNENLKEFKKCLIENL